MRPADDKYASAPATGHKSFDRETSSIGTGNVLGDTQYGRFVRGRGETRCNDTDFAPGALQESDLKGFRDVLGLPFNVERKVRETLAERSGILYCFFSGKPRTVHGWLLSATGKDHYETLGKWVTGPTARSAGIIDAMEGWLTYPRGTAAKGVEAASVAAEAFADRGNDAAREILRLAASAEEAMPAFGAWRLLTDVANREWHAVPPALQFLVPEIDALEDADGHAFVEARVLIDETLGALYRATFPAGEHIESTSCMQLLKETMDAYADRSPAPRP